MAHNGAGKKNYHLMESANKIFIVDAHLDLSMNAMEWNRDLTQTVQCIREREKDLKDKPDRAKGVVSLPELRKGNIGLVVATLIARYVSPRNELPGWHSPAQAWAQTQGQLSWYKAMEAAGEMKMISDIRQLEEHLNNWEHSQPVGYILSLEGADSLLDISYVEKAWRQGLRAIGPAHYGPGRYANGTDSSGNLNADGKALLREMERLNIVLDATHLCDDAFWDAMNLFDGPVWASHNNCRAIVPHNRQFSDDQIKTLIEKGAVIGAALDAWMIVPGWDRKTSTPQSKSCSLDRVIDHIDYVCAIAGNSDHIAIGTDLDGAFGKEQCPYDLETIADLQLIPGLLAKRGYSAIDIEKIMHGNWLRFLRKAWAEKNS